MKKTLIALGVAAGAIAGAQAEDTTTLYGSLGYSVKVADGANGSDVADDIGDNKWDLSKTTAKFGIKGTEDLRNGLQAFFKYEFSVDGDDGVDGTRYAYLGLKGDFGTLTLGKQNSLWKTALSYNDIFHDLGPFTTDHAVGIGQTGHIGIGRVSKVISYVTPDYDGFALAGSIIIDGDNDNAASQLSDSDGVDAWELAAIYDNLGWYAAVAYTNMDGDYTGAKLDGYFQSDYDNLNPVNNMGVRVPSAKFANASQATRDAYADKAVELNQQHNGIGDTEAIGANLGYSNDQWRVGLGYEHLSSTADLANFGLEYYNGPNTFRAGVGYVDLDDEFFDYLDSMNYALGYQYNFSERTYAWIEAEYNDYDEDELHDELSGYTALVGVRHDF